MHILRPGGCSIGCAPQRLARYVQPADLTAKNQH
jgi:hypothetical protein